MADAPSQSNNSKIESVEEVVPTSGSNRSATRYRRRRGPRPQSPYPHFMKGLPKVDKPLDFNEEDFEDLPPPNQRYTRRSADQIEKKQNLETHAARKSDEQAGTSSSTTGISRHAQITQSQPGSSGDDEISGRTDNSERFVKIMIPLPMCLAMTKPFASECLPCFDSEEQGYQLGISSFEPKSWKEKPEMNNQPKGSHEYIVQEISMLLMRCMAKPNPRPKREPNYKPGAGLNGGIFGPTNLSDYSFLRQKT